MTVHFLRRPKSRFARRAFLGGGAVALGLPFLESIAPRAVKAQLAVPVRLVYIFLPNGLDMETFRPSATGANYPTPPMLLPLDSLKSDFNVVTGLENVPGRPDETGDHASGASAFITAAHAFKSETTIQLGISADQVAAQAFGTQTRLPSLQLGIDGGNDSGNCDSGYSCAYTRNISWADDSTPLAKLTNPAQAFNLLFEGFDPEASAEDVARRTAYNASVLDTVTEDVNALALRLGQIDRVKLDQYLTGVNELERRLTGLTQLSCDPGTGSPDRADLDYPAHVQAMHDLIVLAFSCDATRIVTFMFGNALSGRTHPFLGITGGHHDISHHGGSATNIAQLAQIGVWEMEQFAYLLTRLKETVDGADGQNLLFNSSVFLSSDISDGNRHNHDDLPVIVAGHSGGAFTPGRHIAFPQGGRNDPKEPIANLLVAQLEAAGVPPGVTLGDSTGPITDLA